MRDSAARSRLETPGMPHDANERPRSLLGRVRAFDEGGTGARVPASRDSPDQRDHPGHDRHREEYRGGPDQRDIGRGPADGPRGFRLLNAELPLGSSATEQQAEE